MISFILHVESKKVAGGKLIDTGNRGVVVRGDDGSGGRGWRGEMSEGGQKVKRRRKIIK